MYPCFKPAVSHFVWNLNLNQFFKSVVFLANLAPVVFFSMLRLPCCPVGLHGKALVQQCSTPTTREIGCSVGDDVHDHGLTEFNSLAICLESNMTSLLLQAFHKSFNEVAFVFQVNTILQSTQTWQSTFISKFLTIATTSTKHDGKILPKIPQPSLYFKGGKQVRGGCSVLMRHPQPRNQNQLLLVQPPQHHDRLDQRQHRCQPVWIC